MSELCTDVVVIGAGLAGLVAARDLRRAGVEAVVVEARDRVGGRTLNHSLGPAYPGTVVELGGQWVGPGQDQVLGLIAELGLQVFDTHDRGRSLWEQHGRIRAYRGDIPRTNPFVLADIQITLGRLENMARTVPTAAPWQAAKAADWDAQTVASWSRRNMHTRAGREFLALLCEAVWAAEPSDLSLLHLLAYAHSGGGLRRLISTRGGAQQSRIVGGSQSIGVVLAEQLGDSVILNAPVRRIDHGEDVVVHAGEITIRARRVIVAMSPVLAGRLDYHPALPAHRDQLTQRMPNGSVIKCMAVYDAPFWRAQDLSGQAVSLTGPLKVVFDNSPPGGSPGILLGFFEGDQARSFARHSPAKRRAAAVDCFTRLFGPRAGQPCEYIDKVWAADEWTRGCYGAFLPPNTWTSFGDALREPIGPIHWAGSETAVAWMGYMDGAVSSGRRAARETLAALGNHAGVTR
jgi:monoamine oxidase